MYYLMPKQSSQSQNRETVGIPIALTTCGRRGYNTYNTFNLHRHTKHHSQWITPYVKSLAFRTSIPLEEGDLTWRGFYLQCLVLHAMWGSRRYSREGRMVSGQWCDPTRT